MEITVKQPAQTSNLVVNSPTSSPIEPHLVSFFQLGGSVTPDEKRMLSEISSYLGGKSPIEAIDELRNIRFRLGTPQLGVTPIAHMHKYIKLRNASIENEKMAEAMEQ